MPARLAIVIPAGPGDLAWRELLAQLGPAGAQQIALVLAEGDSGECEDAPGNLMVLHSAIGRSRQLNSGARATESDWLWFVHADSRITASTLHALRQFIDKGETAIGYFNLRFLADGPRLTVINAMGAWFRSRVLGLPFGDQGLLMPRRVFDALDGFDEAVAGGEDHAFIWAARARGIPLRALKAPIYTSARKYAMQGWFRTTCRHLFLTVAQVLQFSRKKNQRAQASEA